MNHTKQKFSFIIFCLFSFLTLTKAEEGYRIEIQIDDYQDSSIIAGYYYAEKTLIKDTLYKNESGSFLLEGKDTLLPGVYLFLTQPNNEYVQFMVNEEDQQFSIRTKMDELGNVRVEGSEDNKLFYDYLKYLETKRKEVEAINQRYGEIGADDPANAEKLALLNELDKEVKAKQWEIVNDHPNYISSLLIKANIQMEIPAFDGTEEEKKIHDFNYYKTHYFDQIEFDHPASLQTPFFHQKIDYYIKKLNLQKADSLNIALDLVLQKLENNKVAFQYYLSYFLNEYAQSKIVGMDAVYVHIAKEYYGKEKAPWVDKENLDKILDNAYRLEPTLIGKQAPEFTIYLEDGSPLSLKSIDAKYTMLLFWAPDCGHCTASLPKVIEFYEKFHDKGVEIIAICNKTGDKYQTCWDSLDEKGISHLINAGDQFQKSRIQAKYFVKSTPKIFILDKDKKIIMKNIGSEQLEKVMEELIRIESSSENGDSQ